MNKRLVLAMLASCRALAFECPAPPEGLEGSLSTKAVEVRAEFLSTLLIEESAAARRWSAGWAGGYAALGIAQLAVITLFPIEERPDWAWGGAVSILGALFVALDGSDATSIGPRFAARRRQTTPQDLCALVRDGEEQLARGAVAQQGGREWYMHLGNVLLNVGIGLVLGLGYGRWTSAAINMAAGTLVGELTILTSPNRLISGRERYLRGAKEETPRAWSMTLVATAGPGLGVLLRF